MVLIPIVLALILRAPVPALAFVAAGVALLTVQEFLKLAESYGVHPLRLPTYIFVGAVLFPAGGERGRRNAAAVDDQVRSLAGLRGGDRSILFLTVSMSRAQLAADIRRRRLRRSRSPISHCRWRCW